MNSDTMSIVAIVIGVIAIGINLFIIAAACARRP